MLTFEAVTAGYRLPVVGPVSFHVEAGEVVGLAGPNGIGKSTLFRVLTGDARLFSGHVHRAPHVELAHLRQDPHHPVENPLTASDLFRLTGADRAPLPERLRPLVHRRLDALSGGQLQLVEIWALMAGPADVVLLDEPTRHLDRPGHALLAEWLHRSRPGRAVLIVSHEPDFLAKVCARQVVLNGEHAASAS